LEFVASASNGKEAVQLLQQQHFDIVFLDINMPLVTGIEVMQQLPIRPATIITTAYSDYALDAYRYDAVDYLVKPIPLADFTKAIAKAKIFCDAKKEILSNKTLTLKTSKAEIEVGTTDVACIESYGNYLKVYLVNKQMPVVVYGSLSGIANELDASFVRVHKSYIINSTQIQSIDGALVKLISGMQIPVGRKYQILLNDVEWKR
jgi:two-component system LytT family response regulator